MMALGLKAMMEKGVKCASDDVCMKEVCLRQGKHRHRRVRRHKRLYNRMARTAAGREIRKEMEGL